MTRLAAASTFHPALRHSARQYRERPCLAVWNSDPHQSHARGLARSAERLTEYLCAALICACVRIGTLSFGLLAIAALDWLRFASLAGPELCDSTYLSHAELSHFLRR